MRDVERESRGRRVAVRSRGRGSRVGGAPAALAAPFLPVAFVLLAWLGAALPDPASDEPEASPAARVAVDQVTLLCPPAGAGGVRVARADLAVGQASEAEVRVGAPDGLGSPFDVPLGPVVERDGEAANLALVADGEAAQALFADAAVADASGLAAATCPAPATSWWFPGGGAGAEYRSELSVTNLEQGPAVVDVRLHGVDGPLSVESLRGVTLAPGETRTWPWADVVPGEELLTVEVRAVRGRVVATTREEGQGVDWTPVGATPAPRQQVPAVPAGAGAAVLTVTNPGDVSVRAEIRVVTSAGAFVPLEQGELLVEPGAVAAVDLGEAIGDEAAAVEVTAGADVVVGLRTTVRAARDVASVPAVDPLSSVGAAGAGPGRAVLHLSAGESGAVVSVSAVAADGEVVAKQRLAAREAGLVVWTVPPGAAYVVVEPTRGEPYAAVVRSGEPGGVAVVPVVPLPLERTVPRVLPQSDS